MREDHISSAVTFLQEPEVSSAPLNKRVEFLESKGLTAEEINEAIRRTASASSGDKKTSASGSQYNHSNSATSVPPMPAYMLQQPPPIPQRDWKDYFVMATVSVGVAYGLYECVKRYVIPAIMPPTPAALTADKEAIELEFQRAEQLLQQLQKDTAALKEHEEQRTKTFDEFILEAHDVIREIKEHAEDRKQEAKLALANVETLRDTIPRTLEKHSENSAAAIAELQTEIKSLKQLVSRSKNAASIPIPPASVVPTSLPGFQRRNKDGSNTGGSTPKVGTPTVSAKEPFIPDPQARAGEETTENPVSQKAAIPEWQRALS